MMGEEQIKQVMRSMIEISEEELNDFLRQCIIKTFKRQEILSWPGLVPNEIFFINKGLIRVMVINADGVEHTIHFTEPKQAKTRALSVEKWIPQILLGKG